MKKVLLTGRKEGAKMRIKRKAQSTLEYLLVISAISVAIIYGVTQWLGPHFKENVINTSDEILTNSSERLGASAGLSD